MGIQSTTATTIRSEPNSIIGNQNGKKGKQDLEIKLINIQGLNRTKIVEVEKLIEENTLCITESQQKKIIYLVRV